MTLESIFEEIEKIQQAFATYDMKITAGDAFKIILNKSAIPEELLRLVCKEEAIELPPKMCERIVYNKNTMGEERSASSPTRITTDKDIEILLLIIRIVQQKYEKYESDKKRRELLRKT